jgi:hypothetical protein
VSVSGTHQPGFGSGRVGSLSLADQHQRYPPRIQAGEALQIQRRIQQAFRAQSKRYQGGESGREASRWC